MSHEKMYFPKVLLKDEDDSNFDELMDLIGNIAKHPMEELTIEGIFQKKPEEAKAGTTGGSSIVKSIAFGSTQERPIIPNKFPFSHSGFTAYYRSSIPMGPPTYHSDKWTANDHEQEQRTSINRNGWGFGVLKEPRFHRRRLDYNIDPSRYQKNISTLETPTQQTPPFGRSDIRFRKVKSITPGVGTYNPHINVKKPLSEEVHKAEGKAKKESWRKDAMANRKRDRLERRLSMYE